MQSSPSPSPSSGKQAAFSDECWSEDASDTENFVKTLNRIRGKGVGPDHIASIITHYASKCLPALAGDDDTPPQAAAAANGDGSAASRRKRRRFIESLVGMLPQEKDSVPCGFLLRAMRVAGEAGAEAGCREEIERRAARQLDQAPLKELAALDFEAVVRLVRRFLEVSRSGAALSKVARLVHTYLAEAASDRNLTLPQFVALASAVPSHARATDDGIYRAIDIYIKAHPGLSKPERKNLCMLMESRKLSTEACLHAAQNERLPVQAIIRVLLSEQDKLSKHIDWSASLAGLRSPGVGLATPARCLSKREVRREMEIRRLKEDVAILQRQCVIMETQIDKLLEKKKGYFSWKRLGGAAFKASKIGETVAGASSPFYSGGSRT